MGVRSIASLSLDSRVWISDELAAVFPGATVKNPDWGLEAPTQCVWSGDICSISFTGNFDLTDPGTYEIRLQGQTTGTLATPAREFDDKAGEFGVYFIDGSVLIN